MIERELIKLNEFEFLGIISQLLLEQCPFENNVMGLIEERMCWLLKHGKD